MTARSVRESSTRERTARPSRPRRQTWRTGPAADYRPKGYSGTRAAASGIYYYLQSGEKYRWHSVLSDEAWLWHRGGPLRLLLAPPGPRPDFSQVTTLDLGPDIEKGQRPQAVVPAGHWQSAHPLGDRDDRSPPGARRKGGDRQALLIQCGPTRPPPACPELTTHTRSSDGTTRTTLPDRGARPSGRAGTRAPGRVRAYRLRPPPREGRQDHHPVNQYCSLG
ncbi:cupin domain-containing protein [Streptomyces exfoliatus]|uniref:cupin domain-containing protein n=1 Tax=Streptomyces exfoliatus TaxID=1905 RepID=UPI003C2C9999